jgi:hypothetical protein
LRNLLFQKYLIALSSWLEAHSSQLMALPLRDLFLQSPHLLFFWQVEEVVVVPVVVADQLFPALLA